MIRVIGLSDKMYDHITKVYDNVIAYENSDCNCIEFCEFSYISTFDDHIEIRIADFEDNMVSICFALNDFWRIEIE